jgi:hypothetical protein
MHQLVDLETNSSAVLRWIHGKACLRHTKGIRGYSPDELRESCTVHGTLYLYCNGEQSSRRWDLSRSSVKGFYHNLCSHANTELWYDFALIHRHPTLYRARINISANIVHVNEFLMANKTRSQQEDVGNRTSDL